MKEVYEGIPTTKTQRAQGAKPLSGRLGFCWTKPCARRAGSRFRVQSLKLRNEPNSKPETRNSKRRITERSQCLAERRKGEGVLGRKGASARCDRRFLPNEPIASRSSKFQVQSSKLRNEPDRHSGALVFIRGSTGNYETKPFLPSPRRGKYQTAAATAKAEPNEIELNRS